jgi:quercetin dioxygenase-like cupin family protein
MLIQTEGPRRTNQTRAHSAAANRLMLTTRVVVSIMLGTVLSTATATTAHATDPVGVSSVVLSKQTVNGKDYIVTDITIAPHGSTGWHWHRGEIYGIVRAGTLTHYMSDCQQDGVYQAGDPIMDPTGADHVHLARNLGDTPVDLEVTYIDPAGAPTADSAPNPGCDFS